MHVLLKTMGTTLLVAINTGKNNVCMVCDEAGKVSVKELLAAAKVAPPPKLFMVPCMPFCIKIREVSCGLAN